MDITTAMNSAAATVLRRLDAILEVEERNSELPEVAAAFGIARAHVARELHPYRDAPTGPEPVEPWDATQEWPDQAEDETPPDPSIRRRNDELRDRLRATTWAQRQQLLRAEVATAPSAPPAGLVEPELVEVEPEQWPADEPVPYDRQCEAMAEHLTGEHGAAPEQVPADDLDAMERDHDADHRRRGDRPTPAHQVGHKHVGRRAIDLARQRTAKVAFAVRAVKFGREAARRERHGGAR